MTGEEHYRLFMQIRDAMSEHGLRNVRYLSTACSAHIESRDLKMQWTAMGLRFDGGQHFFQFAFCDVESYEYSPANTHTAATLHIKLTNNPGEIWLNFCHEGVPCDDRR